MDIENPEQTQSHPEPKPVPVEDTPRVAGGDDFSLADTDIRRKEAIELSPNPQVTMASDPISPELNKFTKKIEAAIVTLRETHGEMESLVREYPNLDKERAKAKTSEVWEGHVYAGHEANESADILNRRALETGSDFHQTVEHEGLHYSIRKSRFGGTFADGGQKIDGEAALISVIQAKGQGAMVDIPLYASGVWLQIRPPVSSDLAVIMQKLLANKSEWGRSTVGAIFSTSQIYMLDDLLSFVLDHVHDSNIIDFSKERAKELILASDYHLIIYAMACAMYPNGYLLRQPCVYDQSKCRHIDEVSLNLGKIIWHDRGSITRQQMIHMHLGMIKKYTDKEIRDYQESITRLHPQTVDLGDGITALLKVPSVQSYILGGYEWLGGIERIVSESFNEGLSNSEREKRQVFISKVAIMRQYSPWVNKIVLSNGNTIEDPNTLDEVIATLSADQETVDRFDEAIANYISRVTLSLVALPRTHCSACQQPHSEEYAKHPQLRPLDVVHTFFILLTQRLSQVILRT